MLDYGGSDPRRGGWVLSRNIVALVLEAYKTADETKRNQLIGEAQKIEYDEGGLIIWAFNDQVDAYSEKLGGVVPDKSGVPLSSFHFN